MKKRFGLYAAVWAVLLALFNVIAFVSPGWQGQEKFTSAFWVGYVLITVMLLGQLACAYFALKEENRQKLFYKLPMITTSYTGLIFSFIFGGLCMLISPLPYWVGVIACAILLAINVIAVIKAAAAAEAVEAVDKKVKAQTFFIKSLAVDADTLLAQAKTEEVSAACKQVYEAIRYSDPMSHEALSGVEGQITLAFAKLSEAVQATDLEAVKAASESLLILLKDRNNKCKLLK